MYKLLLLLCLVSVVCTRGNRYPSRETLIKIFGPPSTPTTASFIQNPSTTVPPVTQLHDTEYIPCTTQDNNEGQCVPYYLCDSDGTVIKDGVGFIDIRFRHVTCPSLTVCCKVTDVRPPDNPIMPEKVIRREGCGWRNPEGVGFKITGDKDGESKFGEFPWMVGILSIELADDMNPGGKQYNVYVGGGSLIHPSVVLTTAHIGVTKKSLKVRAGEWDTQTTDEIYPHQDRDVDSFVIHKSFNAKRKNLFYDIMLLFLSSPMDTTIPNVGTACLPPSRHRTPGGVQCVTGGWGKDKYGKEGKYQVILKKVTVPVVENNQCQRQLRNTRLGRFFKLHWTFMCAGGEAGIDTCKGDGGSPLMYPIENELDRYIQSGMVAWGIGCGEKGIPGVYVVVSYFRDWIDEEMVGRGLDTQVDTIPTSSSSFRTYSLKINFVQFV